MSIKATAGALVGGQAPRAPWRTLRRICGRPYWTLR